jgi:hypothetical protein
VMSAAVAAACAAWTWDKCRVPPVHVYRGMFTCSA